MRPDGFIDRTFGNHGFILFDRPRGIFRESRFAQIEEIAIDTLGRPLLLTRLDERKFELIRLAAEQPNPSFATITKRGTLSIRGGDGADDVVVEIGPEAPFPSIPPLVIVRRGPFESLMFDASKVARLYFDGGAGNDHFSSTSTFIETSDPRLPWLATLVGGAGDDTLIGGRRPNTLLGGDGEDVLEGWGGGDVLDGGPGNDHLLAGNGNDRLTGGLGRDYLNGQRGDDRFFAIDNEIDTLFGGAGRDRAEIDAAMDVIDGVERA